MIVVLKINTLIFMSKVGDSLIATDVKWEQIPLVCVCVTGFQINYITE